MFKIIFSKCLPRKIAKFCGFKAIFYTCFDPKYISKYAPDCITDHPSFKTFPGRNAPGNPSKLRATPFNFKSHGQIYFSEN